MADIDTNEDANLFEPAPDSDTGPGYSNNEVSNQDPAAEQVTFQSNAEAEAARSTRGFNDSQVQIFDDGSTLATTNTGAIVSTSSDGTETRTVDIFDDGSTLITTVNREGGVTTTTTNATNATDFSGAGVYPSDSSAPAPNVPASTASAQAQQTAQSLTNFTAATDWRVRLSLAPGANYLYKGQFPGILAPLLATNGVLFPYTPNIQVNYAANYDMQDITHSNYKLYFYKSSSVGEITITADFTAQDSSEANYVLAVIHFFKSVTKMFYGQDQNPAPGTPPPLCYLSGYGPFQFDNHPLVITNFNMSLPPDVDYIRTGSSVGNYGLNLNQLNTTLGGLRTIGSSVFTRLLGAGLSQGGLGGINGQQQAAQDAFKQLGVTAPTYIPTKMSITLTCLPIVTRNAISNTFSLAKYGTGALTVGSKSQNGGIW